MKKFTFVLAPLMAITFLVNCGGNKATKFYSFVFTGTHCSLNNEAQYEEGSKIELTLTAESDDYMIPTELNDITMGGKKLIKDSDYTYNYRNGSLIIPSITGTVNVTANAVNQFNKVDFNMGTDYPIGGKIPPFQKIASGDKVEMPNPSTYIANFERNNYGYVFHHWATEPTGVNSYDFNKPVNSSFTLYAVWEVKEVFKISFNMNSDSYPSDATRPSEQTVFSGSRINEPKAPEEYIKIFVSPMHSKFYFKYWSTSPNGEKYNFNNIVVSSFTLYAIWDIKPPLTITFNKNTDKYPEDGIWLNETSVVYDEKAKAPTKEQFLEIFSDFSDKCCYVFKYWSIDPEGKEEYDFDSTVTSSFSLYANWKKQSAYTVHFMIPLYYPATKPWPHNQLVLPGGHAKEPIANVDFSISYVYEDTEYNFIQWETRNSRGEYSRYDFKTEEVNDDLTIYPKYVKVS